MPQNLPTVVADFIAAGNAYDGDALIATFADDALVNDIQREFWGIEAIKGWSDREIIGDKVTMDVTSVTEHYGDVSVTARMDGTFDKSPFPDGLDLTYYFTVRDGKIVRLIIIHNQPVT
jgi:ketosteroid isomerase-like protein